MFISLRSLTFSAVVGLTSLGFAGMQAAQAQVVPTVHTGTLNLDDSTVLYTFSVTTPGTVILYTTSYGGGANVDGTTSTRGGFDPILSLFGSTGNYIASNDDSPIGNPDPITGATYDAGVQQTLAAGTYQVVVSEYDNFAVGGNISNGFYRTGQGNFTGTLFGTAAQQGLGFIDFTGNQRTSSFTLDIANGAFNPVPEASTTVSFGLLLALGVGGMIVARRKKAIFAA